LPWEVKKKNCVQSNGDKGTHVVVKKKSSGGEEEVSCHKGETNARGSMRARYASETNEGTIMKITKDDIIKIIMEQLDEISLSDEETAAGKKAEEESSDEVNQKIAAAIRAQSQDSERPIPDSTTDEEIVADYSTAADTLTEAVMVALQPMVKPKHQAMTQDEFWMKIAGIDTKRLSEGEVVDMFPPTTAGVLSIAKALASHAAELLDLDGDGDNIEVHVEPALFLSPYIDDYDGQESPPLAEYIYNNYVLGIAGDHAEKLDDIIERIGIDYFDEDIETALKALGDDRFGGGQTSEDDELLAMARQGHDRDTEYMEILKDQCDDGDEESCEDLAHMQKMMGQPMTTSQVSGDSDEDWIYDLEGEIESKIQGIKLGDIIEFPEED